MDAAETSRPSTRRSDLIGQLSAPMRSFLGTEAGSAGILLVAAIVALAWANSPWSDAYESLWSTDVTLGVGGAAVSTDLLHVVNDGLMVLFFLVIGLEVRHEFSVGELMDRRRAIVPTVAGIAGMLVPALLFLAMNPSGAAAGGWGAVIGTDTAFLVGALALFGPRFSTQLRIFLLTLTVLDDIVAVSVIGLAYSDTVHPGPLLVALAALAALALLSRLGAWRAAPYVLALIVLWAATVAAGLHASIAGMLGGLMVAARAPAREAVEGAATRFKAFRQSPMVSVNRSAQAGLRRAISVNERMMAGLHPWTGFVIVPLFALANAGVDLRGGALAEAVASPLTWGIVVGLVIGKAVGIAGGSYLAVRLGLGTLPQGVKPGHVLGGAALSGIGFTVSLLIIGLAFDDTSLRDQATVGVLIALVLATLLGWVAFAVSARFRGEGDADLPRVLDRAVDPGTDHIRGPLDAPVTLVEYGDFECPFCAKSTGVARELHERFGDDLRYVFRHLPLPDVHPHAELAARAAVAADAQGRFWDLHDLLFAHQDRLELEDLLGYAGDLGLDVEAFARALESGATDARVRADVASAEASGARGTPTFFIGVRRHTGPHDTEALAAALQASRRSG
ncbi:MAG: Na+/H+ antiporter NhaA [Candidatus Nanopelagicales bacterium]